MFFLLKRLARLVLALWRRRHEPASAGTDDPTGTFGAEVSLVSSDSDESAGYRSPAARGKLALLAHQVRFDVLAAVRNPRARFFTFMFPILLLVIFTSVFGHNGTTVVDRTRVPLSRYFVSGILAMAIVTSAYAGLVMTIATARETGILKRRRATPVPAAILIGGQALSTLLLTYGVASTLLLIARLGYGVGISAGALAAIAITVAAGALAFACIGYAVAGLVGNPDAAQPVVQATMMPLYFISGVWIPTASLSPGCGTSRRSSPSSILPPRCTWPLCAAHSRLPWHPLTWSH